MMGELVIPGDFDTSW